MERGGCDVKAMILAAGRGRRLRPITDNTPKPLVEVHGKPLIVFHLEALCAAGIDHVVINTSWLGEQIRDRLGDGRDFGVAIEYSDEPEALETAGGILQALPLLGQSFVVVNADVYTDFDFARLRRFDGAAHLVLVDYPDHNVDFGLSASRVRNQGSPCYTFGGIAAYRREFFEALTPGKHALAPLLRAAAAADRVSGELFRGRWHDVGTPESLEALNA